MDNEIIKDFWEENPCGQALVNPDKKDIKDFKEFFIRYDKFRYSTESHILSNLDRIDFRGKRVLEIGIGQGADAQQIIDRGGLYNGIDITSQACERAALRFKIFNKPYESITCKDAGKTLFPDNYFDIIYSHGVLHHIPNIDKVIVELRRILKQDGRLIIMLYARKSLNYYLSILFIRRILFIMLYMLDRITGKKLIKKRLLRKHIENAENAGLLKYLYTANFLSRNTDGPENPYSRVYSKKEVEDVFFNFKFDFFNQYFLNERHLFFVKVLPEFMKEYLSKKFGWHLWCYGRKK